MTNPLDAVIAFRDHTSEAAEQITAGYIAALRAGDVRPDEAAVVLYHLNQGRLALGDHLELLAEAMEEHGGQLATAWREARTLEDLHVADWSADPRLSAAQERRAAGPRIEAHAETHGVAPGDATDVDCALADLDAVAPFARFPHTAEDITKALDEQRGLVIRHPETDQELGTLSYEDLLELRDILLSR